MKFLKLLAREYPTIAQVSTEIINLSAILCLPKGTEHFISDIHGEYESFLHILKNASGVVRHKIDQLYENTVPLSERNQLATLIYYPEEKLELIREKYTDPVELNEWYKITLLRLVEVCRLAGSKYTRSKVRKALPIGFEYIIDELLHAADTEEKARYNNQIIRSIIQTERADAFIIAISHLISRLVIDRLHIVGDIFDRGPGAHIILDALTQYHTVDVQWGNHDIVWMGAAAGSDALIATSIINSLKYGHVDALEDGYGISLRPLLTFAMETYGEDPCARFMPRTVDVAMDLHDARVLAKMHKAMAIILFKLEGDIIKRNPDFDMEKRNLLHQLNLEEGTVTVEGVTWPLLDTNFPTVDPENPYALTDGEQELVDKLRRAFNHSHRLQKHTKFLFSKGSMYLACNDNLLFHGCVPTEPDGSFTKVNVYGETVSGKSYFDRADRMVRHAYFLRWGDAERRRGLDFMWYLWCGPDSPLFGKDKMTTFERYFIEDKSTHVEKKNPYFTYAEQEDFAVGLLKEFGMEGPGSRVVNGHVPVKIRKGESPIKANGRVVVIDGGMSKAYQKETGIAGYTLIDHSKGVRLSCHDPFVTVQEAIRNEVDIHSSQEEFVTHRTRKLVADTDMGRDLKNRIEDLKRLLIAYQRGVIKENGR